MTPLRRALFGYDIGDVKRHLRYIKRIIDMELTEWQDKVAVAEKYRSTLREEWSALATEPPLVETVELPHEEEVAQEEVVKLEAESEAEIASEDIVHETVEQAVSEAAASVAEQQLENIVPARKSTNVIQFRRKLDASVTMDQDGEPVLEYPLAEGTGFWGGVSAYLETPSIPDEAAYTTSELIAAHPQMDGTNLAAQYPKYFNYSIIESPAQQGLSTVPGKERREKQKKAETAPSLVPATETGGSRQITREVRQLRYQYIVGKWAGEDLVNERGELIIAKHQPITEAVIDEADQEGKLALLIVNMTIPGLAEED